METIRTPRLRMEPVTPENAGVLWHVLQEPDLRDYQDLPDLDVRQFAQAVGERPHTLRPGASGRFEWLLYAAPARSSEAGAALGWVSLRISDRAADLAEIGYSVVASHRGRGYASEAVGALVSEAFRRAALQCVRAYCVPDNLASRAVLRRAGFVDDGVLSHGATVQGHPVDVVAHSLPRGRWKELMAESPRRRASGS